MRLLSLRDDGEFSLDEFLGSNIPAYAILSHTWGTKGEEVTYQDLQQKTGKEKDGYRKLSFCGEQAAKDGLRYFWIDTCCIDKASSSELSEALTSMFRWYQNSVQCYAYLADVSTSKRKADYDDSSCTWLPSFRTSRWFTRGWTLQELIAPRKMTFFSKEGTRLGDKLSLEQAIHDITRIPMPALRNRLDQFDVEQRMKWMEGRNTTREEDQAYSMLGIVGVSMLPNYGEGKKQAVSRLRREIKENESTTASSSNEEQRQRLLESLRFEQIDARHLSIKNAHAKTCKWLLKNPQYLDWIDTSKIEQHNGFLWIKGKAGAGKSTLMKYVLKAAKKINNQATLSFFFNARGGDLEKSTRGAYRSLLLQLLEQFPALGTFDSLGLSASSFNEIHEWSMELLKMLLEQVVQTLGGSSVMCFVDALDECDEDQIRDMIQFFERLGTIAASINLCFQICFSSRHYPHITIRKGLELILEGQEGHTQDITNYIETELKIGQSKVAQQIRAELQEKASGIFMWVVLVIGILNKEWDRGQVHALRRKLREIPGDLHALFRDILTRDSNNKASLMLCIQWVLFSKEPLSPEQFYHAILSGVDSDAVSAWDPEEVTEDVLKRFILDCSKGLAETTVSKKKKVSFIHESVRDFLLKENGLGKIWPEYDRNLHGQSHERLKQCCSCYISLNVFDSLPEEFSLGTTAKRELVIQNFPLLEYAVRNVLYHADAAEGSGLSQVQFLHIFPSPQWIQLSNLLEKHQVRRHSKYVSCAYLLAELNMATLLNVCLTDDRCIKIEEERYGCPLFAAAATGSWEAVQVCMRYLKAGQSTGMPLPVGDDLKSQQELVQRAASLTFNYSKKKRLLLGAAELGLDAVVAYLVSSGGFADDTRDALDRTALWWASKTGCMNAVVSLLSAGSIVINHVDKHFCTPLYVASEERHSAIVRLLLDHGADPMQPLYWASRIGDTKVIKMLLEAGVEVKHQQYKELTLLLWSLYSRLRFQKPMDLLDANDTSVENCSDLQDTSITPFIRDSSNRNIKLLLDNGADPNEKAGQYGNVLCLVSYKGDNEIVEMLLNAGADVNAPGGKHGNALDAASVSSHYTVVDMLLKRGAKSSEVKASSSPD
ncbi:hypothetical protein IQ06DRAFT_99519 [Phaeosphaeriaceae sp. SRC1lsM3a]|nr:hypothetical protein IQ06DRAFT_99519 [Stagonospora sp. SRC1lsM3a]